MSLNKNQNILLFCPKCNEDKNITIKQLQNNSMVYCSSGMHDITNQANIVAMELQKSAAFLANDLKRIEGVL